MIELSTNIQELPETENADEYNGYRNKKVLDMIERFREALNNVDTGSVTPRVVLQGTVQKNGTLGEAELFGMEHTNAEMMIKVNQLYSQSAFAK